MRRLLLWVSIIALHPQVLLASQQEGPDQALLQIFDSHRPKLEKGWVRLGGGAPQEQVFKDHMGIVHYEEAPIDRNPIAQEIYYRSRRPDRLEVLVLEYPRELVGKQFSLALQTGRNVFRQWRAVLVAPEGQASRVIVSERTLRVVKEVPTAPHLLDYLVEYGRSVFARGDDLRGSHSSIKTALFFAGNPAQTLQVPAPTSVSRALGLTRAVSSILSSNGLWSRMETQVGLRPLTGLLYRTLQRLAR